MKNTVDFAKDCDHVVGYIGRENEPLVKLVNASTLDGVNNQADELATRGFTVTVFPHCPVCGIRLLAGSYQPKEPVNGKVIR